MAQAYPLGASTFWSGLKVASARLYLPESLSHSRTRGGEILVADQGARLWAGSASLPVMRRHEADAVMAQIEALQNAGASLLVHPVPRIGPINDPTGSTLGAASPKIASLAINGRELTIDSLPVGYVLAPGDMLAFTYGSPTKYALHRIVVGSTAGAGGVTGQIEVVPYIRPGAAVGAAVALVRPSMKAVIVPGSVDAGTIDPVGRSGISFSFIQTLR